jgi:hypothetical protein
MLIVQAPYDRRKLAHDSKALFENILRTVVMTNRVRANSQPASWRALDYAFPVCQAPASAEGSTFMRAPESDAQAKGDVEQT